MLKKIIYSIKSVLILAQRLQNPLSLLEYFFRKPVRLDFKNGISLLTMQPLDAIVVKEIIVDDDYKIKKLSRQFNLSGKIIDVGGAFGDFAVFVASQFPRSEIITIEPNRSQYELLVQNIKLNKFANIKAFNVAIGIHKTYDLYLPANNVHGSTIKYHVKAGKVRVKGKKLDSFINGSINLVKIDCEGAELDILSSISAAKMKLVRQMVIEYHNNIIQNEDKKIINLLQANNFSTKQKRNVIVPQTGLIFAVNKNI